jgi:hypothetical protein
MAGEAHSVAVIGNPPYLLLLKLASISETSGRVTDSTLSAYTPSMNADELRRAS